MSNKKPTYLCSHHEIKLSEPNQETGRITVLAGVVGEWDHPAGKFSISQSDIENMANDFAKKKRDLLFDYDHKSLDFFANSSLAAGWGKEVRATENGLEIDVELTPAGKSAVENKEYRYLSPVYVMSSNRSDRKVTLHSVAFTNIPFLKELPTIKNSEFQEQEGDPHMDELMKLLACSEDQVMAKVKELMTKLSELEATKTKTETQLTALNDKLAAQDVDLAVANGKVKEDQKAFALNLRKNSEQLFTEFLNSTKTETAPQGSLPIPNADQQQSPDKKKLSEMTVEEMDAYKLSDPINFEKDYQAFIENGGK